MVPVEVVNIALGRIGARASVQSINPSDGSTEANIASGLYAPTIQMLLRSAHWNCARRQVFGTQLKSLYVNGSLSSNPPPQPFFYEYALPSDCLKVRFVPNVCVPNGALSTPLFSSPAIGAVPQGWGGFVPFVVGLDTDAQGNLVKVILTNQPQAQFIYTADISQNPDLWDSQFLDGAIATLGAYLVNPLARNADLMREMVQMATSSISSARATDGNEALPSQDHLPDFIAIRFAGGGWGAGTAAGNNMSNWDECSFPGGLRF